MLSWDVACKQKADDQQAALKTNWTLQWQLGDPFERNLVDKRYEYGAFGWKSKTVSLSTIFNATFCVTSMNPIYLLNKVIATPCLWLKNITEE